MLPLRPIIRGPYGENADDDEHATETTIVYTEQHTEVKLNCEVDLDIAAVVWMHNGQVSFMFSISIEWKKGKKKRKKKKTNLSETKWEKPKQNMKCVHCFVVLAEWPVFNTYICCTCLHRKFNLLDTFHKTITFPSNKISNSIGETKKRVVNFAFTLLLLLFFLSFCALSVLKMFCWHLLLRRSAFFSHLLLLLHLFLLSFSLLSMSVSVDVFDKSRSISIIQVNKENFIWKFLDEVTDEWRGWLFSRQLWLFSSSSFVGIFLSVFFFIHFTFPQSHAHTYTHTHTHKRI